MTSAKQKHTAEAEDPFYHDPHIERLAVAIGRALQQSRSVSDSEHYDHHMWMRAKIEREEEMKSFWREMRLHVSKYGALGVLTCVGLALWLGAQIMLARYAAGEKVDAPVRKEVPQAEVKK